MGKAAKVDDVIGKVRDSYKADTFRMSPHAITQALDRKVTDPEISQVLASGHHNPRHDEWKETKNEWNYAIEHLIKTDFKRVRVCVAIKSSGLIICTVIDITKERDNLNGYKNRKKIRS